MQLVGLDSNAFSILGTFAQNARQQGWTKEDIKKVQDEAMSGDYNHLLVTIMDNVEEPDDCDEDDDDFYDEFEENEEDDE